MDSYKTFKMEYAIAHLAILLMGMFAVQVAARVSLEITKYVNGAQLVAKPVFLKILVRVVTINTVRI